jgi:hypothetical protein
MPVLLYHQLCKRRCSSSMCYNRSRPAPARVVTNVALSHWCTLVVHPVHASLIIAAACATTASTCQCRARCSSAALLPYYLNQGIAVAAASAAATQATLTSRTCQCCTRRGLTMAVLLYHQVCKHHRSSSYCCNQMIDSPPAPASVAQVWLCHVGAPLYNQRH